MSRADFDARWPGLLDEAEWRNAVDAQPEWIADRALSELLARRARPEVLAFRLRCEELRNDEATDAPDWQATEVERAVGLDAVRRARAELRRRRSGPT